MPSFLTTNHHAYAFLIALAIGLILVPGMLVIASRLKVLSQVDFRRKNAHRIPLMGGFAIFGSFLITSYFFPQSQTSFIALCALPLILSGIVDDWKELGALPKFLAQIAAVSLFLYFRNPEVLVLEQVGLPTWLANILTAFWMIGVINAFNFIDGMDGVAGGVAFIAALTLAFMTQHRDFSLMGTMIAGASLAFLFFNFPKAKIYLGDAGSTFLGFSLAALAAQTPLRHVHILWATAPMYVLAFPQMDALLAMYRRAFNGISLFKGDHDHIHHLLQKIGFSVRQSLAIIYGVTIYCSITAVFLFYTSNTKFALATLFLTTAALISVLGGLYFIQLRLAQQVSGYSQTLIQKYFQVSEDLIYDNQYFSAMILDLLPYYKELQQRGIVVVDHFISSLSRIIERRCPQAQVQTVGSYSIVLLFSKQHLEENTELKSKLIGDFYSLINNFGIVRNLSDIPEGIQTYSEKENSLEFQNLLERNKKELKTAS